MRISVEGVSWRAGGRAVVRRTDLAVASGETVGLIGPNGSGKSSLLRCVAGLRAPATGVVRYDGRDIAGWNERRRARHVAFVEQAAEAESELRVADVVGLGRLPFRGRWRGPSRTDRAVVAAALERLDLAALADRPWTTLSGGERQRAHLARALAQRPWGLLLDEPTNHLDVRHQLDLLQLLARTDQTVLVALHDLSLAARYCDRLALLHRGALVAVGPPAEVLTRARLREVFGIDAEVGRDSLGNLAVAYRGPRPTGSGARPGPAAAPSTPAP